MFPTAEAYRKAWAGACKTDPPIPLNIDIELFAGCNLHCGFCFVSDPRFEEIKKQFMLIDLAVKIIHEAAMLGVPALKFNWRGEGTLHPDFSEILRYAASFKFHELLVNTNANCQDRSIQGLMRATKVMASLDSMWPETYAKMRRGGNLERAKRVVHELVERGHKNIWVRRVITKENEGEPFAEMVHNEFGHTVHVSEHYCFDRNQDEGHMTGRSPIARTYCGYPSQRLVISVDGLVYPCCVDIYQTMPVGNIKKQTLSQVWDGKSMKKLRQELRANQFESETCKNCTSWRGYKAPQRDFVQDKEIKING